MAMQLAAAGEAAPPPPAHAAAASNLLLQPQQQHGLRLVSFTGDLPGMPGMLAALPAHSLTHLALDNFWPSKVISGPDLAAALARLSNLQLLSLDQTYDSNCSIPTCCLEGVAQLSRLTSLSLAGRWMGGQRPLQQFFAQPLALPLRQLRLALNMRLPKLDLSHCNQLQELSMSSTWNLPRGSALPLQLQRLELFRESGDGESLEELQLQQLQYASLHIPMTAQSLHEMTQLQALQHVALGYNDAAAAVVAAATWQQLPQLRELTVAYTHGKPDRDQMSEILAGVEACSSLTKLKLEVRAVRFEQEEEEEELEYGDDPEMVDERVPACGALAGLTNLRDLRIVNTSQLPHGDALQPTALTGLTSLVLAGLGEGVGELAANALACCQKQLRHLDLQDCDLGSMSCLAAVAHLSQLTELKLEGNSGLARQGLLLLTRLSNLPKLGVEHDRLLTPHAWQRFWAAVHRQQQA